MRATIQTPRQQFHPSGNGQHRLVSGGRATPWASYTEFTYWQGFVGATAYYFDKECVVSADEFCRRVGVTTSR